MAPTSSVAFKLTKPEQKKLDVIQRDQGNSSFSAEEALVKAMWLYRGFFIARMMKLIESGEARDAKTVTSLAAALYSSFLPSWTILVGPAFISAYLTSKSAIQKGEVPDEIIFALADNYAHTVGKYFHSTSTQALVEGFQAYANRKVPVRVALTKATEAYGLTSRQMAGLVAADTLQPTKTNVSWLTNPKLKIEQYILKSLKDRFSIFAKQEDHTLKEQAKQVAWLWMDKHGRFPEGTTRVWITADDEKVCPLCGPLHLSEVGIQEQFKTKSGKLWTPALHVQCRCSVQLHVPSRGLLKKSYFSKEQKYERKGYYGDEPEERDAVGRFARKSGRKGPGGAKPVTEREVLPDVERALKEANELQVAQREAELQRLIEEARPKKAELPQKAKLTRVSLTSPKASLASSQKVSIRSSGKANLAGEKASLDSRASLGKPQKDRATLEARASSKVALPVAVEEKVKADLGVALAQVAAEAERRRAEEDAQAGPHTPFEFRSTAPLMEPIYGSAETVDWPMGLPPKQGDIVMLTPDRTMNPKDNDFIVDQVRRFEEELDGRVEEVIYNEENFFYETIDGKRLKAEISPDDVDRAVKAVAFGYASADGYPPRRPEDDFAEEDYETPAEVDYRNEAGEVLVTKYMGLNEIVKKLNLNREEFHRYIYELNERTEEIVPVTGSEIVDEYTGTPIEPEFRDPHASKVVNTSSGSEHGYEDWNVSGRFRVIGISDLISEDSNIVFRRIQLSPVLEEDYDDVDLREMEDRYYGPRGSWEPTQRPTRSDEDY